MKENISIDERFFKFNSQDYIENFYQNQVQLINKQNGNSYFVGMTEFMLLMLLDQKQTIKQLSQNNDIGLNENAITRFIFQAANVGLLNNNVNTNKAKNVKNLTKICLPIIRLSNSKICQKNVARILKYILYCLLLISVFYIVFLVINKPEGIFKIFAVNNYMHPENIIYYFLSFFILAFFHELSHGIVLASFGILPGRMGIMLSYFHPSCYIEISGINKIKSKFSRIQVWLAGIISQIIMLALELYVLIDIEITGLFQEFLIVQTVVNFTLIFFNLFYVIKLDGYNILCELFNNYSLREDAFRLLFTPTIEPKDSLDIPIYIVISAITLLYIPIFIISLLINIINFFNPEFLPKFNIFLLAVIASGIVGLLVNVFLKRKRISDVE